MSEQVDVDAANAWRLETPGHEGWSRTARADDAAKYFMVSADGHVQEPSDLWATRMDKKFADRLPGVIIDGKGNKLQKTENKRRRTMRISISSPNMRQMKAMSL